MSVEGKEEKEGEKETERRQIGEELHKHANTDRDKLYNSIVSYSSNLLVFVEYISSNIASYFLSTSFRSHLLHVVYLE